MKDKGWIPAFAEERHSYCREILVRSTPQKRPLHWTNMLGGIEKKCSGENILGFGNYTPQNAPRIEKTCSGVLEEHT